MGFFDRFFLQGYLLILYVTLFFEVVFGVLFWLFGLVFLLLLIFLTWVRGFRIVINTIL
jgi:hypothetical protein